MGQGRVGFQRALDGGRVGAFAAGHRQWHDDAAGFGRQALDAVGVLACRGQQHAPARGQEGADGGFHREMSATGEGEAGMHALNAARQFQDPPADPGIDLAELMVPRRIVLGGGGTHPGVGGDGTRDQQQHGVVPVW